MNRYALLIGYAGEPGAEDFLKGVQSDLDGWRRFLTSPVGGNWRSDEIKMMIAPTGAEVTAELAKKNGVVDYGLLVFTGHGGYSETRSDTLLQLNQRECFEAKKLNVAKKQTLILDCCRKVVEPILRKSEASMEQLDEAVLTQYPNPQQSRAAFDAAVNACADGIIVMHSCMVDEFSYDADFGRGGAYTYALLETARNWRHDKVLERNKYRAFSVAAAHNKATEVVTADARYQQSPSIMKMRSAPYFPLCVWI